MAQNTVKNPNLQYLNNGEDGDGSPTDGNTGIQNPDGTLNDDLIIIVGPDSAKLYYYHPDHLGSTSYLTDEEGNIHEQVEYFPFGETWHQNGPNDLKNPYLFTSKELDPETGLYYYGARYYDPRTSVWQSPDPILEKYLPQTPVDKDMRIQMVLPTIEAPEVRFNLPGLGGVFAPVNLNLYVYSGHNPVRYVDPDGNERSESYVGYTKIGGTRAWRNNNPGNIEFGTFAKSQGAVGVESAGRFAKFASPQAGMQALKNLLGGEKYKNLNVVKAMMKYAPPKENDTAGYIKILEKLGVDIEAPVGEQIDKLAEGIMKVEGWKAGDVQPTFIACDSCQRPNLTSSPCESCYTGNTQTE